MEENFQAKIAVVVIAIVMILAITISSFAANGYAVGFGAKYGIPDSYIGANDGLDYIDMSYTMDIAKRDYTAAGYTTYTYMSPSYIRVGSYMPDNQTKMLESDIVLLAGHASTIGINFQPVVGLRLGNGSGVNNYWGTQDFDWSKDKLVILLGCNTAYVDFWNFGLDTLTSDIHDRGAKTVIGFSKKINPDDAEMWSYRFGYQIKNGSTVKEAVNYCNSYINYKGTYIKSSVIKGDKNAVLKRNVSTRALNSLYNDSLEIQDKKYIEELDTTHISESNTVNFTQNKQNINGVFNLIKNTYQKNLNLSDYKVDIFHTIEDEDYYTIDFTYKMGDYITNSGYTVIVENGKVTQITDNTIENNSVTKLQKQSLVANSNIKQKIKEAKENSTSKLKQDKNIKTTQRLTGKNLHIKDQETQLFYDMKTNKKYVKVATSYGWGENDEGTTMTTQKYEI